MRRLAVALLLSLVAAPVAAEPKSDPRAALAPLATSLIDGQYVSGVVLALITPTAPPQVLAWGETVRGNHQAPDGNTVFEIGSVSKVFTGLLLAEAVLDKQVTLETPVATLLPPGTKLPSGKRAITLLDLTTHTSGLPRMPDNFHPADPSNPYADYTVDHLYAFLATAKLAHEPGASLEYSNLGVGLLGQALARRGKADWSTLVTTQITRPLGMTSTMVTLTPEARARFAAGYNSEGDPAPAWDLPTFAGAGALRSTALDLAAFVKAELAASHAPASRLAKAMALTQTPQRAQGSEASSGSIGLAWFIKPDGSIWHNGGTGGYHSFVAFRPAQGVGVVVLANGAADELDQLGAAALAAVSGTPVATSLTLAPPDKIVDRKLLESYVGAYELVPSFVITVTRDGAALYAQATGQPRLRLHATSPRDFAVRGVPASCTFEVGANGKATALILHQGGKDQRAARR